MVDGFNSEKQKLKSKWRIGLIALVVLAAAVIVGVSIYNSPQNRIERQLSLGNKYLEEQKYEEAILEFAKAIEIEDRCLEAYLGSLEAYLQIDKTGEMQQFYEKTLDMITQLDGVFLQENREAIVDIYLYSQKVFEEPEKVVEILEDGLNKTEQNEEIVFSIVEEYLEIIEKYPANYEKQLSIYDRLLEITGNNPEIVTKLEECLNKYINILMMEKNYDKIRELASRYEGIAQNINFQPIIEEITGLERIEEEHRNFMMQVYQAMKAEDYDTMMQLSESDQMDKMVQNLQNNKFIYMSDEMGEGIGVGIHKDEKIIYTYLGQYKEGKREGNGTIFTNLGRGEYGEYSVIEAEWENDTPNGYCIVKSLSDFENVTWRGNFVNGLAHGQIESTSTFSFTDSKYFHSYNVDNGVPTENLTDEWISYYTARYGRVPVIEENTYVYSFIESDNEDGVGTATWEYGKKMGINGFGGTLWQ